MRVIVNDEERQIPDGTTVAQFLELEGEPAGHVFVEVNGEHLPQRRHAERVLAEGDRVEIIHPASGG